MNLNHFDTNDTLLEVLTIVKDEFVVLNIADIFSQQLSEGGSSDVATADQ